jgi:LysM repeat protein
VTRELKLALIVGFSLVLVVTVLVSDHFSRARKSQLAPPGTDLSRLAAAPDTPLRGDEPPVEQLPPTQPLAATPTGIVPDGGRDFAGHFPADPKTPSNEPAPEVIHQVPPRFADARQGDTEPDADLIAEARKRGWEMERRNGEIVFTPPLVNHQRTPAPGDASDSTTPEVRRASDSGGARPLDPDAMAKAREGAVPGKNPNVAPTGPAVPDGSYVVAKGDALGKIAKKFYGSESHWKKLAAYNGLNADGVVREGARLKIPPVEVLQGGQRPAAPGTSRLVNTPAAPKAPAKADPAKPLTKSDILRADSSKPEKPKVEPVKATPREYVVAKGDTLGSIAAKMLGSSRRVDELVALNDLEDEDTVVIGTKLRLPPAN